MIALHRHHTNTKNIPSTVRSLTLVFQKTALCLSSLICQQDRIFAKAYCQGFIPFIISLYTKYRLYCDCACYSPNNQHLCASRLMVIFYDIAASIIIQVKFASLYGRSLLTFSLRHKVESFWFMGSQESYLDHAPCLVYYTAPKVF